MQHWLVPEEKISVVENGVETARFVPSPSAANAVLRAELGAEGKFLVGYVGTMGMAHGLETLLDAASSLQTVCKDVQFLLLGEGSEKERLRSMSPISRARQCALPRPAASRENSWIHLCLRCVPRAVEEN